MTFQYLKELIRNTGTDVVRGHGVRVLKEKREIWTRYNEYFFYT